MVWTLRAAVAILVVLSPVSSGASAEAVRAEVELDPATAWVGDWTILSHGGAFNLSAGRDAERPIVIDSASYRGYHVDKPRVSVRGTPQNVHASADHLNRTFEGAGEVSIRCKKTCEVLLFADEGAEFSISGRSAGPLAPADLPPYYTAWAGAPGWPGDFYYGVPPERLAFGGGALHASEVLARGAFGIFVSNATVEATLSDGNRATWDLGREREETSPIAGGPVVTRTRDRFVVFHVVEGRYGARDSDALLHADPTTAAFDGEIVARSASGRMTSGGEDRRLDGERLLFQGEVAFERLQAEADEDLLGNVVRTSIMATFEGTATRLRIASQEIVQPPSFENAARVSLVVLLLGALALLLWIPLYSRLDRARVLANPTRARILEILRASPGVHATELARRLGSARAVALHHLAMLVAHRFVSARRVGWATHYYLPDAADAGSIVLSTVLADDTRRRIALEVARGVATQAELVVATGESQRLISYHLTKLERAGLVEARAGRPRRFNPTQQLVEALAEPAVAEP